MSGHFPPLASDPEADTPRAASRSPRSSLRTALAFIQVRARFLLALALIGLVVGQWERISASWNWVTRGLLGSPAAPSAVSTDTEFFCPMDPGVVSPWEDKCPICNMSLVRRKKGTAQALPKGVVARMQISPYRLQLAGIKTTSADYLPLVREIAAVGFVRDAMDQPGSPAQEVEFRIGASDIPFVVLGDAAEVRLAQAESPPARGRLTFIDSQTDPRTSTARARIQIDAATPSWRPGSLATIKLARPLADVEPYRSLAQEPPLLRADEPRTVYVSQGHPEVLRLQPGLCPFDKTALVAAPLADNQRLSWWCPMHPAVTASEDGHVCDKCAGMKLLPRVVSYAPVGRVLAVPQDAVIDTGRQQIVFVEVAPGMFEGVRVQLGSRTGDSFPVLAGLRAGQRIVTSGAFLLDAETRLSSQAATAYFGASSNPPSP